MRRPYYYKLRGSGAPVYQWIIVVIIFATATALLLEHKHVETSNHETSSKSTSRPCVDDEARIQASLMFAARARGCSSTDDIWMRFFHLLYPSSNVFVDVGANKLYWAASMYELFQPQLGINAKLIKNAWKTLPQDVRITGWLDECGGCNECRHETVSFMDRRTRMCTEMASITTSNWKNQLKSAVDETCARMDANFKPLRMFSFEANPEIEFKTMFNVLKTNADVAADVPSSSSRLILSTRSSYLSRLDEFWTIENVAITSPNHPARVDIVAGEGELGRLATEPIPPHRPDDERSAVTAKNNKIPKIITGVPAATLDEILLDRFHVDNVDLLKIDVEGHDDDVLQGAQMLFERHVIRVVKFEYGALWITASRPNRTLEARVRTFEPLGYACYFEGKNALLKLNCGCWDPILETKFWSNVWCLSESRASSLISVFDQYSLAFMH